VVWEPEKVQGGEGGVDAVRENRTKWLGRPVCLTILGHSGMY